MNSHFTAHLIQLFISGFLVFFSMALIVEISLVIFRIKNPRIRALSRLLPYLKLPFDVIVYAYAKQGLLLNLNILGCQSYLRPFIIDLLPENLRAKMLSSCKFSIVSWIASHPICLLWLEISLKCIAIVSVGVVLYKLIRWIRSFGFLNQICRNAQLCTRSITNDKLYAQLKNLNARILVSHQITSPAAAGRRRIIFPAYLIEMLSQEEFEAIIAHELEHIRYYDMYTKSLCALVSAFFWWIPARWWLQRLQAEQEQACDASIHRYGMSSQELASAIYKAISNVKRMSEEIPGLCYFGDYQVTFLQRIQTILDERNSSTHYRFFTHSAVILVTISFILTSFWMC